MRLERPQRSTRRPRVSVVIPCYNYARFLPEAVRSATELQPGVDVDVCIVEDASTDGSAEVARELAGRDERISVVAHKTNRGHLQTYNDGLGAVDGEYVVLLSADDLLAEGALQRATALLDSHPSIGFVYGFAQSVCAHVTPPSRSPARSWGVWHGDDWLERVCRRGGVTIINPEVVMRRVVIEKLGGYDLGLPHTADMQLWLRAARIADVGRVNGPVQALYRVHGDNMHLVRFGGVITDFRARVETLRDVFAGSTESRDHQLLDLARRAIAYQALDLAAAAYDRGRTDEVPVDELTELAAEVWPAIVNSARWRLLGRRSVSRTTRRWMREIDQVRDLRTRLLWQRWARFGY